MDNLKTILSQDEGHHIEFKDGRDKIPLSFYETYSAFANTRGGVIYLGIEEAPKHQFRVVGVENAKQKRKQLFDALNNKDKISARLSNEEDIQIYNTQEGDVIRVIVHEASRMQKPVFLNGDVSNSFFRNDSGDHIMSEEKIHSLINDKSDVRYDQMPNKYGLGTNDLDQESLNNFIQSIKLANKIPLTISLDVDTILQRVGAFARDEKTGERVLNNGAILFLGKTSDVNAIAPSLWLDYSYFHNSGDRWSDRVTNKDLVCEGNIFQFYMRSVDKAVSNSPSPYYVESTVDTGKAKVEEMIREAFANAISNLDLFDQAGLKVGQTNNEIVLTNAGTMLVPLENALLGGESRPRNPSIFSFFQALGVSDHGGYGIPLIFDAANLLGFIPPQIMESKEDNKTTLRIFFRKKQKAISETEQKIVEALSNNKDGLSVAELSTKCNIGRDKTRRIVESLCAIGILKDNGKVSKGKKYILVL